MFIILMRLTPYCTCALGERQDYTPCRDVWDVAAHTWCTICERRWRDM